MTTNDTDPTVLLRERLRNDDVLFRTVAFIAEYETRGKVIAAFSDFDMTGIDLDNVDWKAIYKELGGLYS